MPPLHFRRPSQRPAFTTIEHSTSPASALPSKSPAAVLTSATAGRSNVPDKTFLQLRTTEILEQGSTHPGCEVGHPCRNYAGRAPMPRDPRVLLYDNTLCKGRQASLDETEYILSRANCFWARRFSVIWTLWCEDKGGIENEERSQVEFLQSYPKQLREAANDCCPKGLRSAKSLKGAKVWKIEKLPRKMKNGKRTGDSREIIIIDD